MKNMKLKVDYVVLQDKQKK